MCGVYRRATALFDNRNILTFNGALFLNLGGLWSGGCGPQGGLGRNSNRPKTRKKKNGEKNAR